ncbi:MAG: ABC transporter ATP-binding protein [Lachnospiraceae bacterium]|nr:ABC transporter ATP-binding protein [Lachnospiraceae bacterium]
MADKVVLKDVSKIYKTGETEYRALDHVDLNIEEGRFVVILGPSGAGKSTLLNLIGGMDNPTSGDVIVNGENISKYSDRQLSDFRAHTIGFIFQFYNILPSLTVLENVELVKEITKTKVDAKQAVRDVGLENHFYKFPNQLSGGEQQRVSIARAIAKNPALLLCDEPTGALDSQTGAMVLKILKRQCDADHGSNTVIIVTHNALIADTADVVIRVKNGHIVSVDENPSPMDIDDVSW